VPGATVNRLCGSGLNAPGIAAQAIRSGDAELIIFGGVKSMTGAPYVMGKASGPFDRVQKLEDTTLGWRFVNPAMEGRLWRRYDAQDGREPRTMGANVAHPSGLIATCGTKSGGHWHWWLDNARADATLTKS